MASAVATLARLLLLASLGLSLASDRLLLQAVQDCGQVHPQCTSCDVRRTSANGIVQDSKLVCRACAAPVYRLFESPADNSTTCGESSWLS
jgi:hypothetical protein